MDEVDDLADGMLDEPQQLLDGAAEVEHLPLGAALSVEEAVEAEQGEGFVDDAEQIPQNMLDGADGGVDVEAVAAAVARVEAVFVGSICGKMVSRVLERGPRVGGMRTHRRAQNCPGW